MSQEAESVHPVLRATVGIVLAIAAAGFWGWVSESLHVAGITLVCALIPALYELKRPAGGLAGVMLRPFWIGAIFVAAENVLARFLAPGGGAPGAP